VAATGSELMSIRFERPESIDEATRLLAAGSWAVLAGGTDLYPAHVGRPMAAPLLDVTAIAALRGIRRDARGWSIGATTTWSDVARAELPPLFDALRAAAREVGGAQIQNTGTVAGNLCNASPAADGAPVLMALGASAVLRSERGERELPVEQFVLGNRRTARAVDELLIGVRVPARRCVQVFPDSRARSIQARVHRWADRVRFRRNRSGRSSPACRRGPVRHTRNGPACRRGRRISSARAGPAGRPRRSAASTRAPHRRRWRPLHRPSPRPSRSPRA